MATPFDRLYAGPRGRSGHGYSSRRIDPGPTIRREERQQERAFAAQAPQMFEQLKRQAFESAYDREAKQIAVQQKQAAAQAKEAARAAEKQAAAQAKADQAAAKQRLIDHNVAAEQKYRAQGRPHHQYADGLIRPVDTDEQWEAKQAEKERVKSGLESLQVLGETAQIARRQAQEMADKRTSEQAQIDADVARAEDEIETHKADMGRGVTVPEDAYAKALKRKDEALSAQRKFKIGAVDRQAVEKNMVRSVEAEEAKHKQAEGELRAGKTVDWLAALSGVKPAEPRPSAVVSQKKMTDAGAVAAPQPVAPKPAAEEPDEVLTQRLADADSVLPKKQQDWDARKQANDAALATAQQKLDAAEQVLRTTPATASGYSPVVIDGQEFDYNAHGEFEKAREAFNAEVEKFNRENESLNADSADLQATIERRNEAATEINNRAFKKRNETLSKLPKIQREAIEAAERDIMGALNDAKDRYDADTPQFNAFRDELKAQYDAVVDRHVNEAYRERDAQRKAFAAQSWQPITTPDGNRVGTFRVKQAGDEIEASVRLPQPEREVAKSSGGHSWLVKESQPAVEASVKVKPPTDEDVLDALAQADKSIQVAKDDIESLRNAPSSLGSAPGDDGGDRSRMIMLQTRQEDLNRLEMQKIALQQDGKAVVLSERINEAIRNSPLKDKVGDVKLMEDIVRGFSGWVASTRVAFNDATGDTAERDEWREHLRNLPEYFPGSTNYAFRGGAPGFVRGATEGFGGMAPQVVSAAMLPLAPGAAPAVMAGSLSSMGVSAYGANVEQTLSQAEKLRNDAKTARESGRADLAQRFEEQAATIEQNYRALAGTQAAGELVSEAIFPEEKVLLKGAKSGLRRVGEGAVKSFAEGVAAETLQAPVNLAIGQSTSLMDIVEGGAMEAAAGAPLIAASGLPAQRAEEGSGLDRSRAELAASNAELAAIATPESQMAGVVREIAQGVPLEDLTNGQLESVGLKRTDTGEIKAGKGAMVSIENGQPIIRQEAIDAVRQQFPATGAMISMDEVEARKRFATESAEGSATPEPPEGGTTNSSISQADAGSTTAAQATPDTVLAVDASGAEDSGAVEAEAVPVGAAQEASAAPSESPIISESATAVAPVTPDAPPMEPPSGPRIAPDEAEPGTVPDEPQKPGASDKAPTTTAEPPHVEADRLGKEWHAKKHKGANTVEARDDARFVTLLGAALKRRAKVFSSVRFTSIPLNSPARIVTGGALEIDLPKLADHVRGKTVQSAKAMEEFVDAIVEEEAEHGVFVSKYESDQAFKTKADETWSKVPAALKKESADAYYAAHGGGKFASDFHAMAEFIRQYHKKPEFAARVERAMAESGMLGKFKELVRQFLDALREFRKQHPELARQLDGLVEEVRGALKRLESSESSSPLPKETESVKPAPEKPKLAPPKPAEDPRAKAPKSSTQLTLSKEQGKPILEFAKSIPSAELYSEKDKNGEEDYGRETEPHVTVLYGLTDHRSKAPSQVLSRFGPVTVTLGKLSVFENEKYDVLKVDVESPQLHEMHAALKKLPHYSTFPDYKPHMTIAYLKKGEGKKYVGDKRFEGQTITFDSVTHSPPPEVREKQGRVEMPLSKPAQSLPQTPASPASKKAETSEAVAIGTAPGIGSAVATDSGAAQPTEPSPGGPYEAEDYRIAHRPMTDDGGAARLNDLTSAFGEDIYGRNALQYFGSGDPREAKIVKLLSALRGKPDAEITIYRGGVPEGATAEIKPGDWITLLREVAEDYAHVNGGRVVSKRVKARDVTAWADSLLEFGYFPKSPDSRAPQSGALSTVPGNPSPDESSDAEYLAAVERGDMETAQQMVDEAAKRAGYPPAKFFRGDKDGTFTVFDPTKRGSSGRYESSRLGFFFTPVERFARWFGPNVRAFYLSASKPLIIDPSSQEQTSESIDAIESEIKEGRYDSVMSSDGNEIAVLDPSQIKSADPVTRDAQGNVIPLSQRFNPQSNSILETVPSNESPNESSDDETAKRLNESVPSDELSEEDLAFLAEFYANGYPMEDVAEPAQPEPPKGGTTNGSTALKKAVVDKERAERGMAPLAAPIRRTWGMAGARAAQALEQNPQAGHNLLVDLKNHPRAMEDHEVALMLLHKVNVRHDAMKAAEEMAKSPVDSEENKLAKQRYDVARQEQEDIDVFVRPANTEAGRSLAALRMMRDEDWSEAALAAQYRTEFLLGEATSEEERRMIRKHSAAIAAELAKVQELEREQERRGAEKGLQRIATDLAKPKTNRGSVIKRLIATKAKEARARLGNLFAIGTVPGAIGTAPALSAAQLADLATVGAEYIADGADTVEKFRQALVKEFGEQTGALANQVFGEAQKVHAETLAELEESRKPEGVIKSAKQRLGDKPEGDLDVRLLVGLAKAHIRAGVSDAEEMVKLITKDIQDLYPDASEDQVRRVLSGYGKTSQPTKDEIERKLSEAKAQLRLISALEDTKKGAAPLKSGFQRGPQSQRVRQLTSELRNEMRKRGIKTDGPEQLADARKAVVTRLRNQIEDLNAIISGKGKPKAAKEAIQYDEEMKALLKERNELQAYVDDLTGPSPELKWNLTAQRAARASEEYYKRRIASGDFASKKTPQQTESEATKKAREEAKRAKEEFDALREATGIPQKELIERTRTKLAEEIEKVTQRLITGEKPLAKQKKAAPAELQGLKEQLARLRKIERVLNAAGFRNDTQRAQQAAAAVQRSIDELNERIRHKDFAPKEKRPPAVSDELTRLREQREFLKKVYDSFKEAEIPRRLPIEIAVERYQKMVERKRAEMENRLKTKQYFEEPKTDPVMERRLGEVELQRRMDAAQFAFDKAKRAWNEELLNRKMEERSTLRKILDGGGEALNLSRAILTSIDLSAVLRQGGFISLGNPVRAMKAVPVMLKAFASEQAQHAAMAEIRRRKNYRHYSESGLYLTDENETELSKMEEAFMSRLVAKIPRWMGGGLVRGSQRAYTTFLNRLRADTFDTMLATLGRDGRATMDEAKALASYINVATGRGIIGRADTPQGTPVLSTIFFSPRLLASRFNLLAGQPLYGGTKRTRGLIAKEYAKFATGVSLAIALAALAKDEEDKEPFMVTDPRSSDFLKVRFGKTRLDFFAGLLQAAVFASRVFTGERVDAKGQEKPLRESLRPLDLVRDEPMGGAPKFGEQGTLDVMANFMRSKLSPALGTAVNLATGKDFKGDPVSVTDEALRMLIPISYESIKEVMADQGAARGSALSVLSLLGAGVQTYDASKKTEPKGMARPKTPQEQYREAMKRAKSKPTASATPSMRWQDRLRQVMAV